MKEVVEDVSIPLLSTTLIGGLGLWAAKKFIQGPRSSLAVIPGILVGIAAYAHTSFSRQVDETLSESESDKEN